MKNSRPKASPPTLLSPTLTARNAWTSKCWDILVSDYMTNLKWISVQHPDGHRFVVKHSPVHWPMVPRTYQPTAIKILTGFLQICDCEEVKWCGCWKLLFSLNQDPCKFRTVSHSSIPQKRNNQTGQDKQTIFSQWIWNIISSFPSTTVL